MPHISTHTLTWSVTVENLERKNDIKFQLTRSRGAWRRYFKRQICNFIFQLTRSRGAWPLPLSVGLYSVHFNSHAHVERDSYILNKRLECLISTHTLTWSVTSPLNFNDYSWIFQLTRSRGAWRHPLLTGVFGVHFNSHAHVERDTWCCVYLVLAQRDADLFFYLMGIGLILFTVHSHIAWHFHANLLGICGSLGVRWSKY